MNHTHTYSTPPAILPLSLPDVAGRYDVLQVWRCACGEEYGLASAATQGEPLLGYTEAQAAYQTEQRGKRVRTVLKRLRGR